MRGALASSERACEHRIAEMGWSLMDEHHFGSTSRGALAVFPNSGPPSDVGTRRQNDRHGASVAQVGARRMPRKIVIDANDNLQL
jgi:hypothetical protein